MAWQPPSVMITVNNFSFCGDHGLEWCGHCCCDYRMVNNVQIEDQLADEALGESGFDVETRKPIDVFALGAVPQSVRPLASDPEDQVYECQRHQVANCTGCFDWVKMVKEEARQEAIDEKWLRKRQRWFDAVDS